MLCHWIVFYIYILLYLYYNNKSWRTKQNSIPIYILLYLYYNLACFFINYRFFHIYILLYLYYNNFIDGLTQSLYKFIFYFIYITTASAFNIDKSVLNLYSTLFILQPKTMNNARKNEQFIFYFIYITTLKSLQSKFTNSVFIFYFIYITTTGSAATLAKVLQFIFYFIYITT